MGTTSGGLFSGAPDSIELLVIIIALGVTALALIQWLAWIFALGRWRKPVAKGAETQATTSMGMLFASAFLKLFDNFRHLLAMVVVLIFAVAVIWVLCNSGGSADTNLAALKDGLQVVVATLGGLVGSILGYYFGESRGQNEEREKTLAEPATAPPPPPPAGTPPPPAAGAAAAGAGVPGITPAKSPTAPQPAPVVEEPPTDPKPDIEPEEPPADASTDPEPETPPSPAASDAENNEGKDKTP